MRSHERSDRRRRRADADTAVRVGWPVWCWLFVLVAIGVVQIVRLQWFDAAVFFVAAFGAGVIGRRPAAASAPARTVSLLVLSTMSAVLGAVLCFLPRHSAAMQAIVIAAGAVAVWLAVFNRAVAHPDRSTGFGPGIRRLALAWAVIVIIGCVWELVQFILGLLHPDAAWFALSDLLNPLAATVPGKIVLVVAWLAGGVWLLRRGGRR